MVQYDSTYRDHPDYFGSGASPLLERFGNRFPSQARVLDIGAGQGRNCLPLARQGCQVTAIDISGVAVEAIGKLADQQDLSVALWQGDFMEYEPTDGPFEVVLCFGLLQTLDRTQAASLIHRLRAWTRLGGLVLLTAWHTGDPSYPEVSQSWDKIGQHSFQSREGECRTFLEKGEILKLLQGWEILHHLEGDGPEHTHPGGPPERHGVVEVVAVRR